MAQIYTFDTKDDLISALAKSVSGHLRKTVAEKGSAYWAVSGGNSPIPLFDALNQEDLDWLNIHTGLVDDRWVAEDHSRSNAAMVKRTLLQNKAANAPFYPLYRDGQSPFDCAPAVSQTYTDHLNPLSLVILGMGPDGHTASLFPKAKGLDAAFDPDAPMVVPIEAIQSAVTGEETLRLTLSAQAIAACPHVILLLTGQDKKEVFNQAQNGNMAYPMARLLPLLKNPLHVYYTD